MAASKENADDLKFNIGESVNGFKLVKKIDEGGFGQVFKVTKDNETFYAMKLESSFQEGGSAIKLEINVLNGLPRDSVFPGFVAAGRKPRYHYLVLELLGDNLKTLKSKSPNPDVWTDGTWSRVGIQCFYAIKKMHESGFVHRDIKPNNFAIGINTSSELRSRRIFLFDFGLARRFIHKIPGGSKKNSKSAPKKTSGPAKLKSSPSRSKVKKAPSRMAQVNTNTKASPQVQAPAAPASGPKKLVPPKARLAKESRECASISREELPEEEEYAFRLPRPHTDFRGTPQYASPNAHLLKELGRHDDIWSLMYMIAEFFNELPWSNNEEIPPEEMKDQSTILRLFHDDKNPDRLTSAMRHQLEEIDKNLKEMNYYSFPNYELVYKFLKDSMDKAKVVWDTPFDWELGPQSPIDATTKSKNLKKKNFEWENPA
ncbi:hypothetical protein CRE_18078 [Caenorhabditis remanei]|uniref:Protein kinase domain-containing protein n=1 Tax=Caenorhabditis remanei TaxID=31234 RepID=E3MTW7_CAERE|nr:hypothetical protein CRE_18078 [Caenorhabditis remanei]